jgi:hypothetical protein
MAVDRNLIEGAYQANRPMGVPGAEFATKISAGLTQLGLNYMRKKSAEAKALDDAFRSQYESAAVSNDLGAVQRKQLQGYYNELKQQFAGASREEQSEMIFKLQEQAKAINDAGDLMQITGELASNNFEGISFGYKNSQRGRTVINTITDKNQTLVTTEEGEIGYMIGDNFSSIQDLTLEINKNIVDTTFRKGLDTIINNQLSLSAQQDNDPGYTIPFNNELVYNQISKLVNSSNNINSIATDSIHENEPSFYDHAVEALMQLDYKNLGISDDIVKQFDTNKDGVITESEAINIMNNLLQPNNEYDLKRELIEYYSTVVKQQGWNVGAKSRTKIIDKDDEEIIDKDDEETINTDYNTNKTNNTKQQREPRSRNIFSILRRY